MKVKVTQKNKTKAIIGELEPGDGFLFDGYPYLVCETGLINYTGYVPAVCLRNAKIVTIRAETEVQLSQIDVEYTV